GEAAEGETVPGEARIGEARLREAGERYLRLRRHVEAAVAGRPAEGRPGGERAATGGPREGGGSAAAGPGKGGGSGAGEPEAVQAAGGSAAVRSGGAWLLNRPWGPQPYPSALEEPDARPRPSLLEAMAAAGAREAVARLATRPLVRSGKRPTAPGSAGTCPSPSPGGDPARADEEVERLRRALGRRRERLGKRRAALRRELEKGPAPEELRETGHLLLARLPEIPRGAAAVTLEGFDGSPRTVELDPALPAAANAERLFREAARRERAAKRLPPQLARVEAELARVEEALGSLEEEGPTERLREAAGGSPPSTPTPKVGTRLPYLRLRSSGGLEIRVGRGARANDELTLHHSAPEDIWLHAHQVRGAHVILRWGRREENPPRQDLLEAAIVAAVHSRARHSGTVAVDWTRRKYVRKPRKAPPGAVRAERVKTVFAEPNAGLVERLKIRATREER
ncbi:MAG: NFACT RNA binding domain-containing protein, partial [Gemmatimonadota bacterium]